ncbi:transcriptional regulator [Methanosarcina sp. Ant1]|nr:transcriptional regulator [Methanosarcina sp. Ant1]
MDSEFQKRKEPKESDFKAPEELETGYTEKSRAKPEETMEGKEVKEEVAFQERKEPKESDFKASGELETSYTEKSWAKPEEKTDEKTAGRAEEARQEAGEEAKEREAKEREAKEREAKEREAKEREAKEREAKEREAKEREAKEREAREERRTVYTMEKRLTKSKTDRKLFGVCGGLGEYFGIDPTLVRLAFVLLALFNGIGLVLYIILAVIIPSEKNVEMVPSYRK